MASEPEEPALIFSELAVPQLDTLLTDSWTCSFVDYNNDGFDDLFFTERNISKPNYLFRNTGGNGFERILSGSMVTTDAAISISSTWADVDNDGDLDVLVLNNTLNPNFYYTNNGNGSFTRNQNPGFASEVSYYHGASWVDFDNDGLLDVYLSNFWSTRFNELWKNTGGGNFLKTDNNDISQTISQTVGATWADYNNDGFQDLFVPGNEGAANLLFRNTGNGNFEKITSGVVVNSGGFSVGSCWGDIDNDGDMDLFVANSGNQNNDLFINQGDGTFVKRLTGPEVNSGGHSHGCSFADIDNDADLDLYVTNDQGNKFLYLNDGLGNFSILAGELITDNFGLAFGHAWSDIDHDGDLDLAVATHSNQANRIFINNGNLNHWIQIKLTGTNTNKSAIGAKVRILSDGNWQMRELNAQSGLGGQSSQIIHFGLGISNSIDSLIVYWPGGHLQRYSNVIPDQIMAITEQFTSLVTGVIFADLNGNCIMDAGEPPIPDYQVSIPGYEYVTYTNENGEYTFDLPNGMYEMLVNSTPSLSIACDSMFAFAVSPIIAQLEFLPIGLIPDCPGSETALVGFTTAMRRGFDNLYQVQLANSGYSASGNDILNVTFPEGISILSSNPQWLDVTTVNGGSTMVSFQVPPMQAQDYLNFNIIYNVGLDLNIGEEISIYSTLEMQNEDCNAANNSFNDFQTITGSFDPNDLLAWPEGTGSKKLITADNKITYRIRFQNIGNSYATHVFLHDIIPAALDPESISGMHSSHPYFVSIHDNLLKVEFRNIYLPDSAENEEASNGYFEFEIAFREDAPSGARIANRAAITFDFNEPIYTNEIIHTLVKPEIITQDQLVLFPNPSGGEFFIVNPFEGQVLLRLISVDGNFTEKLFQPAELLHVNESHLKSGFYVVEIISAEGEIRKGKLIIS
ncbi:MAG: FG-GAP-like repeat-containing protein [Bacteroidia bacterium]